MSTLVGRIRKKEVYFIDFGYYFRLRGNSHNPFHRFIKLNEKTDVTATISGFVEDPARLEAVVSGC